MIVGDDVLRAGLFERFDICLNGFLRSAVEHVACFAAREELFFFVKIRCVRENADLDVISFGEYVTFFFFGSE